MTLLLLAGTAEAIRIAQALADRRIGAIASLAGITRNPASLALPTRIGGFGGAAGFVACLEQHRISMILDATHPFADRITQRTAQICAARNLPYLYLCRPAWVAAAGDHWIEIQREEEAAAHIPPGDTVFLATGRQTLDRFANLAGRQMICRQIDPPEAAFPFPGGSYLVGRPPFSVAQEIDTFERLGVDWLIVKNAGGASSRTKLDAARALKIPVLMIRRPAPPDARIVDNVADALAWAVAG